MVYTIKKIAGVETIFAPMQDANSITVQIFVRAGSIYETRETNGISHFLEHMFFKWGKKYLSPKSVAEAFDVIWWEFNAYTASEYASYYVKCAPEFVGAAIDVLWDMLVNSQFPQDEMEREKMVVQQEIMMKQDHPTRLVMEKQKLYYNWDNPYGWSILGPLENVQWFTQEDLFAHKNALYTKDNLIVVVAGRIRDQWDLETMLEDAFVDLPEKKTIDKPVYPDYLPTLQQDKFVKNIEQSHLVIAAPGFQWMSKHRYAANVLWVMLGGNMSSRLFQNVREKEWLCYYISGAHYSTEDNGEFYFRAGLDKERFAFGLDKILDEIHQFSQDGFELDEFEKAIGYLSGQLQMGIESSDEMAEFLWSQYIVYKDIETLDEVLASYKWLRMEDLTAILDRLDKKNMYAYWIE